MLVVITGRCYPGGKVTFESVQAGSARHDGAENGTIHPWLALPGTIAGNSVGMTRKWRGSIARASFSLPAHCVAARVQTSAAGTG